jgi:excisionase family DNA binding protein
MEERKQLAYSVNNLAKLLDVHPITLRRLIDKGEIRRVRMGDRVLIPHKEVERLLKGGK